MKQEIDEDNEGFNLAELISVVECCNGPNLEVDCCFDCSAHHLCKIEGKCGGIKTMDFHGDCSYFNDPRCPHNPDYVLPPIQGIKLPNIKTCN